LAGTLDQAATGKGLGDAAVSGILVPEDVFRRVALRQAAGADDLQFAGILAHENGSGGAVVPVTHGVENRLPDRLLAEGRDVPDEKAVLEMLEVVAEIDGIPQGVVDPEEPLPKFKPLLGRAGRFR